MPVTKVADCAQVTSEMLAAHVLAHYNKFLAGIATVATFETELQVHSQARILLEH